MKQGWTHGTLNGARLEYNLYVKPIFPLPKIYDARKDVYVKNVIIPGLDHLLEPLEGDKIEFKLHPPKFKKPIDNKPSAKSACILSYCAPRSFIELQSYFSDTLDKIENSSTRAEFITSLMSSEAIWFYFFNVTCENDHFFERYIRSLLNFVFSLSDHMESFPSRRKEIFGLMLEKNFIGSVSDKTVRQSYEYMFIEFAVTMEPLFLKDVIPWISRIMEGPQTPFTGILYKILMKLADIVDLSNWKELTQIPSIKEILGDPLERVSYLRPILLKSGYIDGDDYLNVYYRLLRAECFSAVQKGIVDFRRGKLDPRDMDIYDKVSVVDIDIDHTTILLSLKFTSKRPVHDWSKSKKLMYGNLLCLSIKGDFSDPIWLTVSERDGGILQKFNVIGTELISFHCSDVNSAEIIRKMLLHSGTMVMAESPTYFKSFQHVLSSLKVCQMEDFNLYNEIVHGDYTGLTYLFKEKIKDSLKDRSSNLFVILETISYLEMEEHQQDAFWHAMESRLGIIQGPPGTGKTYVGVKLVRMFLELQKDPVLHKVFFQFNQSETESDDVEFPIDPELCKDDSASTRSLTDSDDESDLSDESESSPILVLTYKNHALDEFLMHCTTFCDKIDITRLGSQSKEESLKDCQIHVQMKTAKIFRTPTRGIIEETESLFEKLSILLRKLQQQKVFNFATFITCLSVSQLSMFASNALRVPWRWRPQWPNLPNNNTLLLNFAGWERNANEDLTIQLLSHVSALQTRTPDHMRKSFNMMQRAISCKLLDAFSFVWLPDKENVKKLARLQKMGAAFFNVTSKTDENVQHSSADVADFDTIDDLDEDYVNEQLSLRRSAFDEDGYKQNRSQENKSQRLIRLSRKMKERTSFVDKKDFTSSDFPESCQKDEGLLAKADVWNLSEIEKYAFIYSTLHLSFDDISEEMNVILEQIDIQQRIKRSTDEQNKLVFLKNQKIVGATIVGASVHLSLIQKLAPKIVLVEEAAEVLEPCLVAVLTKSVEKLILIGDHKQLKPQVDTYHLRKEYNFHISMMERLVGLGFPYEKLVRQGRMRPEFSCMLKDIYPDYDDFEGLSDKNEVIKCLSCSMFFWSHDYLEVKDRSARNPGEANMVLALALFFIASGIPEDDITILCAYLGQVQLVRKMYRDLNPISTPSGTSDKKQINIRTIDEYQGDENRFVIISLTRSNNEKNIGFLKEVERRCVAQSRAKCGMYFIGNVGMFRRNKTWEFITNKMETMNLVDSKLPICCFRHPSYTQHVVQSQDIMVQKNITDNNQLMYYVQTKDNWCQAVCDVLFECEIEDHRCKKLCTPRHDDSKCLTEVSFTFTKCEHETMKKCHIKYEDMKCLVKLTKTLDCGHDKSESCHQWLYEKDDIKCYETCSKFNQCISKHACNKICHRDHSHYSYECTASVEFRYPGCNHLVLNYLTNCNDPKPPKDDRVCKFRLKYESEKCGHKQSRFCSEIEKCTRQCDRNRPDCGHRCAKKCFEPCIGGNKHCVLCELEHKKILVAAKAAAKMQLQICIKEASDSDLFSFTNITDNTDELSSVTEKCQVFFSLYSKSRVKNIVSVWKVKCPSNDINFWKFASYAFGPLKEELYNLKQGFLDCSSLLNSGDLFEQFQHPNPGYDPGYEFTKYASRSFTSDRKGNNDKFTVFISDIMLGDRLNKAEISKNGAKKNRSTAAQLKTRKKNSVIETKPQGPASYYVYNSNQILPTYIVHLSCEKNIEQTFAEGVLKGLADGEHKYDLSSFNLRDQSDPMCDVIQRAISLYKGDCSKRPPYKQAELTKDIKSVGVVVNQECEKQYEKKKSEFKQHEFEEVFGYHATEPGNIASIIKSNLDPDRRPVHGIVHGKGCYFSEHPQFSFEYGKDTMLIFKLLLVKNHYTKVKPDEKGFCQQLVLQDTSMFKPQYVLHF